MRIILVATVIVLVAVQQCHTQEVIAAINAGGPPYRSSYNIYYNGDTNQEGVGYTWQRQVEGLTADHTLYARCRHSPNRFTYMLSLRGDGLYALYLHFSDDSTEKCRRQFDVVLNNRHAVLRNIDLFDECGQYNVCNQVIYFSVCNGVMYLNGESSSLPYYDQKLSIDFVNKNHRASAVVDGLLLMKGRIGQAKTIIPAKSVIYFDPAYFRRCDEMGYPLLSEPAQ
uniref:Malectin domain-containing protein n=1 Tax=Simulium vittatum TaxID=7192 RepID=B5M0U8_SIMVI|nr:hypothetical protein [Simulium vittatum]